MKSKTFFISLPLIFIYIYIYKKVCVLLAKNEELKDREIPLNFNFFIPLMIIISASCRTLPYKKIPGNT